MLPHDGVAQDGVDQVVREVQPLQLRYGASYDTERGIGGIWSERLYLSGGEARAKLGWSHRIGFRELVREMVASDLKAAATRSPAASAMPRRTAPLRITTSCWRSLKPASPCAAPR